jgi:hypothetical protein
MWESDSEASDVADSENLPVEHILNYFRYNHGRRFALLITSPELIIDGIEMDSICYPQSTQQLSK